METPRHMALQLIQDLSNGNYKGTLGASKSKLAPVWKITISRLELCEAVLACRLRNFIEGEMDLKIQ